ncbi:hypothetical protein [Sphingobacterium sp. HMA12]|uniref:hypothetical protein n=1 Tax=Sphingobacterium sp. HMA12 TaxID=2050894 RepID=UPI000CEA4A16|nr:hypothetical protein [Sphingobacterium sp. HMA12]
MDILRLSTEWAKSELFSAKIIGLFSVIVILSAIGFALWGKTTTAKAFVIPLIVSGLFLIAVGIGLYAANKPRLESFQKEYNTNANAFVQKEIERTTKSQNDFKTVFNVLPLIIITAAILFMVMPSANWRAIAVTLIVTASFLLIVDSNTSARNNSYREQLMKYTIS